MEFSFASLLIGLTIGAIGGLIGGLWWQRSQPEVQTARKVAREHEQLKTQVADHFVETAQLVNQLTDSYKDVMDHLRSGAITLVDRETLDKRLPHNESEAVTVMRISSGEGSVAPAKAPNQKAQDKAHQPSERNAPDATAAKPSSAENRGQTPASKTPDQSQSTHSQAPKHGTTGKTP